MCRLVSLNGKHPSSSCSIVADDPFRKRDQIGQGVEKAKSKIA